MQKSNDKNFIIFHLSYANVRVWSVWWDWVVMSYLSMVITGKCIQERSASGVGIMQRLPVVIQRSPYTVNLSSNLKLSSTKHTTAQVKYLCQDRDHSH